MGTERVQEAQYMKTPKCWESVWYASKKAAANKVDEFSVTENTINIVLILPSMPLPRYYDGRKV